ncbi:hypothetical protein AAG906_009544 [Vitis piasezkii]
MEKSIVSDAFDYKGAPADRAKTGGWVSAAMILSNFLLCLLDGCIADSFLGWYWTIPGSCILAISATLPTLKEKTQMAYFNRFYLLISIGTIQAVTVIVHAQDDVQEIDVLQVIVAAIRKRKLEFPSSARLLIKTSGDYKMEGSEKPNPWRLCTVTRVEELKMMVRILPFWATTIFYCTVHAQMVTSSVQQAATLDRSIRKFKYLQLRSLSSSLGSPLGQQ